MKAHILKIFMASVAILAVTASFAWAQLPALDTPALSMVRAGHGKVVMTVTGGATGAPAGFGVWWMKYSDFANNGLQWFSAAPDPRQGEAYFVGAPLIHVYGGQYTTFLLGPNLSSMVEIGDLYDESGVISNAPNELTPGEAYVFTAYALDAPGQAASPLSPMSRQRTMAQTNCTFNRTQWAIDPSKWPQIPPGDDDGDDDDMPVPQRARLGSDPRPQAVDTVAWQMPLGSVTYTKTQTQNILTKPSGISEPVRPVPVNGSLGQAVIVDPSATLIALAHQLIAAKLNLFNGASVPANIRQAIRDADALIGPRVVPPVGTDFLPEGVGLDLIQLLGDFNNGLIGPGQCLTTPSRPTSWGQLKRAYR